MILCCLLISPTLASSLWSIICQMRESPLSIFEKDIIIVHCCRLDLPKGVIELSTLFRPFNLAPPRPTALHETCACPNSVSDSHYKTVRSRARAIERAGLLSQEVKNQHTWLAGFLRPSLTSCSEVEDKLELCLRGWLPIIQWLQEHGMRAILLRAAVHSAWTRAQAS